MHCKDVFTVAIYVANPNTRSPLPVTVYTNKDEPLIYLDQHPYWRGWEQFGRAGVTLGWKIVRSDSLRGVTTDEDQDFIQLSEKLELFFLWQRFEDRVH